MATCHQQEGGGGILGGKEKEGGEGESSWREWSHLFHQMEISSSWCFAYGSLDRYVSCEIVSPAGDKLQLATVLCLIFPISSVSSLLTAVTQIKMSLISAQLASLLCYKYS